MRDRRMRSVSLSGLVMWLAGFAAIGCGNSSPVENADRTSPPARAAELPPVAAISAPHNTSASPAGPGTSAGSEQNVVSRVTAPPGSPAAMLLEIARLVGPPAIKPAQTDTAAPAAADSQPSPADSTAGERRRLERIVEMATQVIAATHTDPRQEQAFNNAVHYLSDARLELASAGDAAQAQLLIDDADSLYERDHSSFAAAEAGFKVVNLAAQMADALGNEDPDWLREYSHQASIYAQRFPGESSRAALALFRAGRLCDRFGLSGEARGCLQLLQQHFASSVFAEQSVGILRRLSLEGRPVELAGNTIDGGFADIAQYRGRVVVVVFWASTSPTFREQLPLLKQVEQEFSSRPVSFIGVNLDTDEAAVDQFLAQQQLVWPQIFSADASQRGGRNPVARYYGIQVLPMYWLIGGDGVAKQVPVSIDALPERLSELLAGKIAG